MSRLGEKIQLKGISQKGKNRIREFGPMWIVLALTDHVLFQPNLKGPWLFVAPPGCTQEDKASRWIHGFEDPDFTIIG